MLAEQLQFDKTNNVVDLHNLAEQSMRTVKRGVDLVPLSQIMAQYRPVADLPHKLHRLAKIGEAPERSHSQVTFQALDKPATYLFKLIWPRTGDSSYKINRLAFYVPFGESIIQQFNVEDETRHELFPDKGIFTLAEFNNKFEDETSAERQKHRMIDQYRKMYGLVFPIDKVKQMKVQDELIRELIGVLK